MCRNSDQDTPLHWAALEGHIDVVKFLTLEMHCDPTSRNADSNTALHVAAGNGHLDVVQFFISDQNCDPNISGGQYNRTSLHYAAQFGRLNVVKYLTGNMGNVKFLTLKKFCDPMCRDSNLHTPLHMAVANGHLDIVKFLTQEKHCDVLSQDLLGNTFLHDAVMQLNTVKFFIEELKCPPDITEFLNMTPLQIAKNLKHSDIADYLQKHSIIHTAIAMMQQLGYLK